VLFKFQSSGLIYARSTPLPFLWLRLATIPTKFLYIPQMYFSKPFSIHVQHTFTLKMKPARYLANLEQNCCPIRCDSPSQYHFVLYISKRKLKSYCGLGSSVSIAIVLRAGRYGIESRWGRDFPPVQTGPGAHPASCTKGTGSFPGVK